MAQEATIVFYKVTSCGYYSRGRTEVDAVEIEEAEDAKDEPNAPGAGVASKFRDHVFGDLQGTLTQLKDWGALQSLKDAMTFTPKEASSMLPVHLVDVAQHDDCWLVTLWNRTHEGDGVPSLPGESVVGSAKVKRSKIEAGDLPGFATYFWFIPKDDLVAAVMIGRPFGGVGALQAFARGFLRQFSKHAVKDDGAKGKRVVFSYRENAESELRKLVPNFTVRPINKPGDIEFLKAHVKDIRKLVRRDTWITNTKDQRAEWQKLINAFKIKKHQPVGQITNLYFETDISLSADDFDAIVNDITDEDGEYGFLLKKEAAIRWVGRSSARGKFNLELAKDSTDLFESATFLAELARQRKTITDIV